MQPRHGAKPAIDYGHAMGIPDCIWNLKHANRRFISRVRESRGRLRYVLQELQNVASYWEIILLFYYIPETGNTVLRVSDENTLTHVYRAYCNFIAYRVQRIAPHINTFLARSLLEIVKWNRSFIFTRYIRCSHRCSSSKKNTIKHELEARNEMRAGQQLKELARGLWSFKRILRARPRIIALLTTLEKASAESLSLSLSLEKRQIDDF